MFMVTLLKKERSYFCCAVIFLNTLRARSNSVVRAFAHGAMGIGSILHGGPNELFFVHANNVLM